MFAADRWLEVFGQWLGDHISQIEGIAAFLLWMVFILLVVERRRKD